MDLEGKVIGNRYEIIEKIGNGGMATVYKAMDTTLKRYVAVKVLKDEFTTDADFIKRFNIEAQAAASLTHPNIVSIYDVGNEGNIYYIVMELIQGKTLKEIIEEDGVLPWKWSLNISIQIASALETAHKNNIVHRDIKPHNIIITEDGIAKVTDFGIAKAVSNSTLTAFGSTIGSVHYLSPEQAKGGYTDAKSDLYSLGVVMYEMLTGRVPFDADTPVSIVLKHMQETPIEPIKLNPSIPYSVNKIILKAMKKDVNARYQTATEMLKDLGMALKNPDGDFVTDKTIVNGYTQVVQTLSDEEIKTEEAGTKPTEADINSKKKKKSKIGEYFKKHPAAKVILIIALIILIPVCAYFGAQAILNWGRVADVDLPNFTEMSLEEAELAADEAGLVLEITEEYSTEVEEGYIISQDPEYAENYTVKEGSTVNLVVSLGTDIVTIPEGIEGSEYEEALETLEALGLVVEKVEQNSSKVESGYVISISPEEGSEINMGETVTVNVSTGTKQIEMQYVIGETESSATKTLENLGFSVTIVYEEDTSKDDGVVLKQSIATGTTVDTGTKVTLTVNQIEEDKTGTINVNLKSLTGGATETDEDGNIIDETVTLKITVDGETVYEDEHSKNDTDISVAIKGKGTVTVKVFVDGVRKAQESFNLNSSTTLNID